MKKTVMALSILLLAFGFVPVMAQETNNLTPREQKKIEKQKRKEMRIAAEKAENDLINKLVHDTAFVFVANRLYGNRGVMINVDPGLNFLGVHHGHAVYQFAFQGLVGWNGVGGATFEGDITKYKFEPAKNHNKASNLTMTFRARGVGGNPYVTLTFFGSDGTMDITFNNGDRVRLDGEIKSIKDAGVFKGQSLF